MDAPVTTLNENRESEQLEKVKQKKRLTPAALKKLQAKAAEEARQQLIRQKQEYLKETKKRVQLEWEINQEKAQMFENEFLERQNLFLNSSQKLTEIDNTLEEYNREKKKKEEWERYLKCDRLPVISSVAQMNTYIFVWTELEDNFQMSHCLRKTEEVMQLLKDLEEVINDPGPDRPTDFLVDMKGLRSEMRSLLQEHIDKATFYMFSRIETEMVFINVTTCKYFARSPYFLMSLWAELITPIPSSKEKEKRNPLKVVFEEVEIMVIVPVCLLDVHKVMRAMWLNYDHSSDKCRTYDCPPLPHYYWQNLYGLFLEQHSVKEEILSHRENLEMIMKKKIESIPPEPTLSEEIMVWESEPQRALSDEVVFKEFEEEDDLGHQVKTILDQFEVNLRERIFLGNFLLLEVLHQPPQAKHLRFKHSVTLREEFPKLKPVDYHVKYSPHKEATEEEQEEQQPEKRRTDKLKAREAEHEEELKNFVLVQLKLCESVIWFEQPQLASWDPVHNYWSTEDIHDITFDEEEGTVTFKTGRLGLMGFHVNRYCSFPYEDWLLEPSEESGINFYLKTSKSEFYFKIKEGKVCLDRMDNVPTKAMNWILGHYYTPIKLMEHLKKGGIDMFPAPDASCYISEIKSKHVVLERNIYQVYGLFSKSFRFKRSRFNQEAGRSNIVFQAQEIYKNHQCLLDCGNEIRTVNIKTARIRKTGFEVYLTTTSVRKTSTSASLALPVDFCLIQTAMCSSFVLDINEESENYSPEKAVGMQTYIDFFSLLQHNSTGQARRQADATCYLLIQTIKEFLEYVRPISFS